MDQDVLNLLFDKVSHFDVPRDPRVSTEKAVHRFYSARCRYMIRRRIFVKSDNNSGLDSNLMTGDDVGFVSFGSRVSREL
jgi:hypothetical protein